MKENSSISLYRDRLDETLAVDDLVNVETLRTLVKDQIVRSSKVGNEEYVDNIVETRTKQVSNFLAMLRSASVDDVQTSKYKEASHGGWKVKQDTEEFRVMYREGPEGTPFHTLLVEGYVDGPLDVCLCISWEASLYPKWWPQMTVPSFRIISSQCLQNVRVGEQICLVRMKLSWPLSTREALIHYFEFEYFQKDLVVVLLNSVSDLESVDKRTHGFTRDGLPDAQDVVRIDVVGGFALQKVSANRSYFRTIANMDVKLDFVPPAFINFVSRQVIGGGFKLYKKEVASVAKGDEDFSKALKDPLYTHVGEALHSNSSSTAAPQLEVLKNVTSALLEEQLERKDDDRSTQEIVHNDDDRSTQEIFHNVTPILLEEQLEGKDDDRSTQEIVHNDDLAVNSQLGDFLMQDKRSHCEIKEIKENDSEESECLAELSAHNTSDLPINQIDTTLCTDNKKVVARPEVEQALRTLDKVISVFKEYRSNDETRYLPDNHNEGSQNLENIEAKESVSSEADQICRNSGVCAQSAGKDDPEMIASYEPRNSSGSRRTGSTNYSRDANHNKVAPASSDEDVPGPAELSSENQTTEWTIPEKTAKEDNMVMAEANGAGENNARRRKNRKPLYCCFRSLSWQLSS